MEQWMTCIWMCEVFTRTHSVFVTCTVETYTFYQDGITFTALNVFGCHFVNEIIHGKWNLK